MNLKAAEASHVLEALSRGQPPPTRLAAAALVGFEEPMARWTADLAEYVAVGGSLVRIISAPSGAGKTHLARALQAKAAELGFLVCQVDAQAQDTDDDLALYKAVCSGLRAPSAVLNDIDDAGLPGLLADVAIRMTGADAKRALTLARLPIPNLVPILSGLIEERRRGPLSAAPAVLTQLISGQPYPGDRKSVV